MSRAEDEGLTVRQRGLALIARVKSGIALVVCLLPPLGSSLQPWLVTLTSIPAQDLIIHGYLDPSIALSAPPWTIQDCNSLRTS